MSNSETKYPYRMRLPKSARAIPAYFPCILTPGTEPVSRTANIGCETDGRETETKFLRRVVKKNARSVNGQKKN
jgi:hypothetical protein